MKQFDLGFRPQDSMLEAFQESRTELETGLIAFCQVLESEDVDKQGIYPLWSRMVNEKLSVDRARIKWIWRTLMTDSHLGVFSITNADVFRTESIEVLQAGTLLVLVIAQELDTKSGPKLSENSPPIIVKLNQKLCMKSASSGNLDCKDVDCTVYIPIAKHFLESDLLSKDALPMFLSVPPSQISTAEFKDFLVLSVEVQSINQAYTVASRLIESGH